MTRATSEPPASAQVSLTDVCQGLTDGAPTDAPPAPAMVERLLPWVEVFSKLATVAVLLLAFLQYYDGTQDKKRERAMQLVQDWVENGQPEGLTRVSGYVEAAARAVKPQIEALPSELQERAWDNARENTFTTLVVPQSPEEKEVRAAIDALLRFFARAEICVSSGLCDPEVTRSYFLIEARSMHTELAPFIARMRKSGVNDYGRALDALLFEIAPEG